VILGIALVASGCSDSDDEGSDTTTTEATSQGDAANEDTADADEDTADADEDTADADEDTADADEDTADDQMSGESVGNIAEVAEADGRFTTLLAAVEAAGLEEELTGTEELTVFAPTDEAFAALPEGTVDALLADPDGALTDILTYHVVPGAVMAETVMTLDGEEVETLAGGTITVGVDGDAVTLTDATGATVNVVATDVKADNGVIHVIDGVLMPE
jgi:uncharacterized surface protein with fasciclin (FAS1) repeats